MNADHAERISAEWLRERLSAVAKQQGGQGSTARRLRNRVAKDGLEGLSEGELALALELIGVELVADADQGE